MHISSLLFVCGLVYHRACLYVMWTVFNLWELSSVWWWQWCRWNSGTQRVMINIIELNENKSNYWRKLMCGVVCCARATLAIKNKYNQNTKDKLHNRKTANDQKLSHEWNWKVKQNKPTRRLPDPLGTVCMFTFIRWFPLIPSICVRFCLQNQILNKWWWPKSKYLVSAVVGVVIHSLVFVFVVFSPNMKFVECFIFQTWVTNKFGKYCFQGLQLLWAQLCCSIVSLMCDHPGREWPLESLCIRTIKIRCLVGFLGPVFLIHLH